MMSNILDNLRYTSSHEWVLDNADGTVTVGITDHAQSLLGDVVFIETPDAGLQVNAGEEFTVIESVKAASSAYAPVGGEVIAFNDALESNPEIVNQEPYTEGWIVKLKPTDLTELDNLLSATAYQELVEAEE